MRKFIYGPGIDEPICIIDVADGNNIYYYHLDSPGNDERKLCWIGADFDMKLITWLKAKSWWFKSGLILAFLHLVFMSWIIAIIIGGDAQWQLVWILPQHVDFPISLLHWHIILPIVPNIDVDVFYLLPAELSHLGGLGDFIAPCLFYLLGGTVWFFYLPTLLGKISKKIATRTAGRLIAVLLMTIPIFSSWLQIFRSYTAYGWPDYVDYIFDWTYYLSCGLWAVLAVWLFFVGHLRKVFLLVLFLLPLVLYYPMQDLYIYLYIRSVHY